MSQLSHLKLVAVKKPRNMPAIVIRRNKLGSKLWEQIQLAKSQLEGTPFIVMKYKTVKDRETGLRKQVEVPKRIKPWWFQSDEGKVCVSVKYGSWTLELAKGKPSVEVASGEALIKASPLATSTLGLSLANSKVQLPYLTETQTFPSSL